MSIVTLQNDVTGEEFEVDLQSRSVYRFTCAARGLDRFRAAYGLVTYFLTLTLRSDNLDVEIAALNKFMNFMRNRFSRAKLPLKYLWVPELQRQRYVDSGELALHWHVAIVCPEWSLPNVEKTAGGGPRVVDEGCVVNFADLGRYWGRGFVWCVLARGNVEGYMSKYLTKDYFNLAGYNPDWEKLRGFGSSQLGYWSFPAWAYALARKCEEVKESLDLKFQRRGGTIIAFFRDAFDNWLELKRWRSPWRIVSGLGFGIGGSV